MNPMKQLVFVTHNPNKAKEIKAMAPPGTELLYLDQIGCYEEIEETGDSLQENASLKAWYVYNKFKVNCFADDTGLEVDVLDGRPGVRSARYAGEGKNDLENINKLLEELKSQSNRKARFRTVISLIINGEEMQFEGTAEGQIIDHLKGKQGFGYDPVFVPEGYSLTFAEMSLEEKNTISHRYKAFKMLAEYLMSMNYL
jgi:XTP/dITP diphosphohydrolase